MQNLMLYLASKLVHSYKHKYRTFFPARPVSNGPPLPLTLCQHSVVCCTLGRFNSQWQGS